MVKPKADKLIPFWERALKGEVIFLNIKDTRQNIELTIARLNELQMLKEAKGGKK